MRRFLSLTALSALSVLSAFIVPSTVSSAPGGGGGGSGSGSGGGGVIRAQERRVERESSGRSISAQRGETPAFQISGKVVGGTGGPLTGIMVKMFTNGVVKAATITDVDGSFEITANPMSGGNNTTDIWFQSPNTDEYLDTNVVLSVGSVAREHKLFPSCTQEVSILGAFVEVEVTMLTLEERKKSLAESECLEDGIASATGSR